MTAMFVVTLLMLLFLGAINVMNFYLTDHDSRESLENILERSGPGGTTETGPGGPGGGPAPDGTAMTEGEMPTGEMPEGGPGGGPAPDGTAMTEGELPDGELPGNGPGGPASDGMPEDGQAPDGDPGSGPAADGESGNGLLSAFSSSEDLGRYFVARTSADGELLFADLTNAGDLTQETMLELINQVSESFTPETVFVSDDVEVIYADDTVGEAPGMEESTEAEENNRALPGQDSAAASSAEGSAPGSGGGPGEDGGGSPGTGLSLQTAVGRVGGFMYRCEQQANDTVVYAFRDIRQEMGSALRVLGLTLALGLISWLLILLLVIALARRAILPIAENIQRQREFITNAGHELKTPLAAILANTDVQELHSGQSKWLDNIRSQALRLSDLTRQMLLLSRMDEWNEKSFVRTDFDASAELSEILGAFRERASLGGIALKEELEEGVFVHASREQFHELADILLDNAVKYVTENGTITVCLKSAHREVQLDVSNDCGELPEELDQLFERFYRGDRSRSRATGGSGIGLAVARAIAESGGGSIRAYRSGEKMVTFAVRLPKGAGRAAH